MDLNGEFMFSICSFDLIWGEQHWNGRTTVVLLHGRPVGICDRRIWYGNAVKLVSKWEAHYNAIIMYIRCTDVHLSLWDALVCAYLLVNECAIGWHRCHQNDVVHSMRMFYAFVVNIMAALLHFSVFKFRTIASKQSNVSLSIIERSK